MKQDESIPDISELIDERDIGMQLKPESAEKFNVLLEEFINDFEDHYGHILPREDLITKIKENISTFEDSLSPEVQKISDSIIGFYQPYEKKMALRLDLPDKNIKRTFYHEMIHAITSTLNIDDFNRSAHMGFEINNTIHTYQGDKISRRGYGMTEGLTEIMTSEILGEDRNNNYDVLYPANVLFAKQVMSLVGNESVLSAFIEGNSEKIGEEFDKGSKRPGAWNALLNATDRVFDERNSQININSMTRSQDIIIDYLINSNGGKDFSKNLNMLHDFDKKNNVIKTYSWKRLMRQNHDRLLEQIEEKTNTRPMITTVKEKEERSAVAEHVIREGQQDKLKDTSYQKLTALSGENRSVLYINTSQKAPKLLSVGHGLENDEIIDFESQDEFENRPLERNPLGDRLSDLYLKQDLKYSMERISSIYKDELVNPKLYINQQNNLFFVDKGKEQPDIYRGIRDKDGYMNIEKLEMEQEKSLIREQEIEKNKEIETETIKSKKGFRDILKEKLTSIKEKLFGKSKSDTVKEPMQTLPLLTAKDNQDRSWICPREALIDINADNRETSRSIVQLHNRLKQEKEVSK